MTNLILGDSRFFWEENIKNFIGIPQAWDSSLNSGVGQPAIGTLWINTYLYITALFSLFGFSWNHILLLFWVLPAIILSVTTPVYLYGYFFPRLKFTAWVSGVLYLVNTYAIMILSGGQIGVMLAYSILPLVIHRFIVVFHSSNIINALLAGLVLSIQFLFDPRFVYLSLIILTIYLLFFGLYKKAKLRQLHYTFLVPFGVMLLLHNFWLVPMLLYAIPSLPEPYLSSEGFKFFSFADFSHAFSLLHPNWPENIFGKVSFLKPEFLFLPVLAYSSLLIINSQIKSKNLGKKLKAEQLNFKTILFLTFLGLFGTFLSKGSNNPFGGLNIYLFKYFPGMNLFRDPIKFYTLTAFSYSFLIPFSLTKIYSILLSIKKSMRYFIYIFLLLIYISLLAFQFLSHNDNFSKIKKVPDDYLKLKKFIVSENEFYRTLWIPQWQRYGYFSDMNPAIGRGEIIPMSRPSVMARTVKNKQIVERLKFMGVKYIILPFDSDGELFLSDSKYDEAEYLKTKRELDTNQLISKTSCFGKLCIYELKGGKDRFWTAPDSKINWTAKSATKYKIVLKNGTIDRSLLFVESYSPYWVLTADGYKIYSKSYQGINSFNIPKNRREFDVYYEPQTMVTIGIYISGITLIGILSILIIVKRKE